MQWQIEGDEVVITEETEPRIQRLTKEQVQERLDDVCNRKEKCILQESEWQEILNAFPA